MNATNVEFEQVEDEIFNCLKEIQKFEEDRDKIFVEEYGGGPDESCLKGTKNALRLFALDILRITCEIETASGILGCFDSSYDLRIDYVTVVDEKAIETTEKGRIKVLIRDIVMWTILAFILFCLIVGFIVTFRWASSLIFG